MREHVPPAQGESLSSGLYHISITLQSSSMPLLLILLQPYWPPVLFHRHVKSVTVTRSLPLLFPLPRTLLPKRASQLTPSSSIRLTNVCFLDLILIALHPLSTFPPALFPPSDMLYYMSYYPLVYYPCKYRDFHHFGPCCLMKE